MKIRKHKEKSRLIIYKGNELLLFQKVSNELEYGLIGGFLKKGESPEEALIRETYEETSVRLSSEHLKYHTSITIDQDEKNRLTKHYFVSKEYSNPFILAEPQNFRKIEWVYWEDAIKSLNKSDKKIIKELFKPCKINHKTQ
ncbi:NUDIX hydrolase [Aquimarina sp. SS2-1]|uniref:NUDIX hydrolase n=1 Tax=Aquimarina besae TaxID=3342247 RepID=UPI00366CD4C6